MKHSKAWIIWLITTMVILLTNRNPIYLVVVLTGLLVLGAKLSKKNGYKSWLLQNSRFLGTMIVLSSLINALFTHTGNLVLFRFPEDWLLIGGKITLESFLVGMINGLVIGSLYITFNIINLALSVKQITRLIPNIFHPIAIMITISLTFFPSIQQRAQEIKEAQMIRGNPMKRISDWSPLLLPLLISSLENAFLLSESMTARGFSSNRESGSEFRITFPIIIAVFIFFSGWVLRLYQYPAYISILCYFFGACIIFLALFFANRKIKLTRFHQETWRKNDTIPAVILLITFVIWTALQLTSNLASTNYSPNPSLSMPSIQVLGILPSLSPWVPMFFFDK